MTTRPQTTIWKMSHLTHRSVEIVQHINNKKYFHFLLFGMFKESNIYLYRIFTDSLILPNNRKLRKLFLLIIKTTYKINIIVICFYISF
jgi:hypothetical protein